ncbi:unnamed protein product [Linum tenue]|uniref:Uncharacterized protein n=1 Tax=Linum tenue TaxID=586396 RepID=A0AAV0PX39_9ROSI|nr:unnamed protein product [Linum tenue]
MEFVNREAVERIASQIGKPVKVDRTTMTGDREESLVVMEADVTTSEDNLANESQNAREATKRNLTPAARHAGNVDKSVPPVARMETKLVAFGYFGVGRS